MYCLLLYSKVPIPHIQVWITSSMRSRYVFGKMHIHALYRFTWLSIYEALQHIMLMISNSANCISRSNNERPWNERMKSKNWHINNRNKCHNNAYRWNFPLNFYHGLNMCEKMHIDRFCTFEPFDRNALFTNNDQSYANLGLLFSVMCYLNRILE